MQHTGSTGHTIAARPGPTVIAAFRLSPSRPSDVPHAYGRAQPGGPANIHLALDTSAYAASFQHGDRRTT